MTKAWETIAKSVSSPICTMEGGCGNDLPLSELVTQIGLLEVPDTTQ